MKSKLLFEGKCIFDSDSDLLVVNLTKKNKNYSLLLKNNFPIFDDLDLTEGLSVSNSNGFLEKLKGASSGRWIYFTAYENEVKIGTVSKPGIKFENNLFIFRQFKDKYLCDEDLSLSNLNEILKLLGFNTKFRTFEIKNKVILVDGGSFVSFIDELSHAYTNLNFLNILYKNILRYKKHQINLSKASFSNKKKILLSLKSFLIKNSIIDHIINMSIFFIEGFLDYKFRITSKGYPQIFRPHKTSLTTMKFISKLDNDEKTKAENIIELNKVEKDDLKSYKFPKKASFLTKNLQRLLWLHDSVNCFMEGIIENYKSKFGVAEGQNILDLCELPLSTLELNNLDELFELYKNSKLTHSEKEYKSAKEFPLGGVVASTGNFAGKARLVISSDDITKINTGDIIVTDDTKPSFVQGMMVCEGIIAQNGGITSHAAIVSRELGKPCLISVDGCMNVISEGDVIEVIDGLVYKR